MIKPIVTRYTFRCTFITIKIFWNRFPETVTIFLLCNIYYFLNNVVLVFYFRRTIKFWEIFLGHQVVKVMKNIISFFLNLFNKRYLWVFALYQTICVPCADFIEWQTVVPNLLKQLINSSVCLLIAFSILKDRVSFNLNRRHPFACRPNGMKCTRNHVRFLSVGSDILTVIGKWSCSDREIISKFFKQEYTQLDTMT